MCRLLLLLTLATTAALPAASSSARPPWMGETTASAALAALSTAQDRLERSPQDADALTAALAACTALCLDRDRPGAVGPWLMTAAELYAALESAGPAKQVNEAQPRAVFLLLSGRATEAITLAERFGTQSPLATAIGSWCHRDPRLWWTRKPSTTLEWAAAIASNRASAPDGIRLDALPAGLFDPDWTEDIPLPMDGGTERSVAGTWLATLAALLADPRLSPAERQRWTAMMSEACGLEPAAPFSPSTAVGVDLAKPEVWAAGLTVVEQLRTGERGPRTAAGAWALATPADVAHWLFERWFPILHRQARQVRGPARDALLGACFAAARRTWYAPAILLEWPIADEHGNPIPLQQRLRNREGLGGDQTKKLARLITELQTIVDRTEVPVRDLIMLTPFVRQACLMDGPGRERLADSWLTRLTIDDPTWRSTGAIRSEVAEIAAATGRLHRLRPRLLEAIAEDPWNVRLLTAVAPALRGGRLLEDRLFPGTTRPLPELVATASADWPAQAPAWLPKRGFSVRLSGSLQVTQAGDYLLGLETADSARLDVDDGALVIWATPGSRQERTVAVTLPAGRHPLLIEYRQLRDQGTLRLLWQPPGATTLSPVPPDALAQPDGSPGLSVVARGGYAREAELMEDRRLQHPVRALADAMPWCYPLQAQVMRCLIAQGDWAGLSPYHERTIARGAGTSVSEFDLQFALFTELGKAKPDRAVIIDCLARSSFAIYTMPADRTSPAQSMLPLRHLEHMLLRAIERLDLQEETLAARGGKGLGTAGFASSIPLNVQCGGFTRADEVCERLLAQTQAMPFLILPETRQETVLIAMVLHAMVNKAGLDVARARKLLGKPGDDSLGGIALAWFEDSIDDAQAEQRVGRLSPRDASAWAFIRALTSLGRGEHDAARTQLEALAARADGDLPHPDRARCLLRWYAKQAPASLAALGSIAPKGSPPAPPTTFPSPRNMPTLPGRSPRPIEGADGPDVPVDPAPAGADF